MRQVDSLGMTMNLSEKWGKEAAAIHPKIDFLIKWVMNRRCFLPPNTLQKPVIPNESTLHHLVSYGFKVDE